MIECIGKILLIVGEPLSKILENAYRLAIKILSLVWNSLRHSPHDRTGRHL